MPLESQKKKMEVSDHIEELRDIKSLRSPSWPTDAFYVMLLCIRTASVLDLFRSTDQSICEFLLLLARMHIVLR